MVKRSALLGKKKFDYFIQESLLKKQRGTVINGVELG